MLFASPASEKAKELRPQLWRLSWAEWRAHPWRQAAALVSIALGVALALSVHLINESALAEFAAADRAVHGRPDLSLVGAADGFDEAWLDRLSERPEVAQAFARIEVPAVLLIDTPAVASAVGQHLSVRVVGIDALSIVSLSPELLPRPETDSAASEQRFAALDPDLGFTNPALARELGRSAELRVVAQGQTRLWRRGGSVAAGGPPLLVMDIAAAQAAFGFAGRLSRIDLRLKAGADLEALRKDAALVLPSGARWQVPEQDADRMSQLSRAYRVNLTVLALVALVVGGFLVFSVVSLAVVQRTPALALLGVLGLDAAGRRRLILGECTAMGAVAGLLGVGLGTALAALALRLFAGDLGGGYFGGEVPPLHFSGFAGVLCAGLGLLAAVAGGAWPAASAAQLVPAQALKGYGGVGGAAPPLWPGLALLSAGGLLAQLPPVQGLPLGAYAGVAALLVGGIALLPSVVGALLGQRSARPATRPLLLLGLQRARFFRATATAAMAGIVASLALCIALTVMVASFRLAVSDWLASILPADLYVRAATGNGTAALPLPEGMEAAVAMLPGVQKVQGARSQTLSLSPAQPDVWLQARDLGPHPEQTLPLVGTVAAVEAGQVDLFVSEAMVSLYGIQVGSELELPLAQAPGGVLTGRVRGVWRDFARQFGSVLIDRADYQRLTGDGHINELAMWLAPGATPSAVEASVRSAMARLGGVPDILNFASTTEIKSISLQIFDRSFAVTRYLQAVAIAIGLAGAAASLSAQVIARRREFGLLAHLGLTRGQVLRLVLLESAAWLAAALLVGLLLGLAISAVLVWVVNPQSFHWTMPLRVPWDQVLALMGAVAVAGLGTAGFTARQALAADAVRAVKEDW